MHYAAPAVECSHNSDHVAGVNGGNIASAERKHHALPAYLVTSMVAARTSAMMPG
jgi:hypothetical protein